MALSSANFETRSATKSIEMVEQEVRVMPERVDTEAETTKTNTTPKRITGKVWVKICGTIRS